MVIQPSRTFPAQRFILKAAPFIIVALAGMAVRTPVAAAHPATALLLFLWIVSDAMTVSLIARASSRRPRTGAVLGVLAGASCTVWLGSPPVLRHALLGMPAVVAGMMILVLGHITWATVRASQVLGRSGSRTRGSWVAAASEILPSGLVRLAAAELSIINMAVFRWGGPADVPADCRAFSYHRHLAPMGATMLFLSTIEIAVYHILVGHWSRAAAIVIFVLSDLGFVYLLGLIKSFRFRPILVAPDGVRVRGGFLIDQVIPFGSIAAVETGFTGEAVRNSATLNAALLAWPNVLLRLDRPVSRRSLLKRRRSFSSVAFRLDEPEPFVRLLLWRLGQKAG